jgi:hypothetical protein
VQLHLALEVTWIENPMKFSSPIPILRSFDEFKAKEFYVNFLGFNIDWEHRFEDNTPLYMQLSKSDCIIHVSEHHGDSSPGASLRINTLRIRGISERIISKKIQECQARHSKYALGYSRYGYCRSVWQ